MHAAERGENHEVYEVTGAGLRNKQLRVTLADFSIRLVTLPVAFSQFRGVPISALPDQSISFVQFG